MKDNSIDKIFENLKGTFDIESPNEGHEQRFLNKLNSQNATISITKRKNYWKPILSIAASVIILIAVFIPVQKSYGTGDLSSISPELATTQDFFTTTINAELERINSEKSPETEQLISDALKQIILLEQQYDTLLKDLKTSGNDKRVIHAMISNFQNRINLLEDVLKEIETIKQLKQEHNENIQTI